MGQLTKAETIVKITQNVQNFYKLETTFEIFSKIIKLLKFPKRVL